MNAKIIAGLLLALFIVIVGAMCAFTVDETQQVVITRFSKVDRTVKEPGLKFKLPVVERAIVYPRNLQEWDGDPGEIPTKDKTYIYVDTFARWKIVDPVLFFKTIGLQAELAAPRLNEIIDPAVRNLITSNRLIESVRNSNRELDTFEIGLEENEQRKQRTAYAVKIGRQQIDEMILKEAQPKLEKFGIDLVDVKIKRLNYREEVRRSVYDRMIAERKQIAQKFRSEGKGEAQKILGDKELDLKRIRSEAYRKAQEIKGRADAQATRLYAEAFGKDPEFYSFVKTMEIYDEALDKDSTLILSTDSDLLKYLKGYSLDK
jgi:modulator of FtsH protease HflC